MCVSMCLLLFCLFPDAPWSTNTELIHKKQPSDTHMEHTKHIQVHAGYIISSYSVETAMKNSWSLVGGGLFFRLVDAHNKAQQDQTTWPPASVSQQQPAFTAVFESVPTGLRTHKAESGSFVRFVLCQSYWEAPLIFSQYEWGGMNEVLKPHLN